MSGCRQHELQKGPGDGSRWKDPLTDPDIEAVVPVKEGEKAIFFVLRSLNHDNLAVSTNMILPWHFLARVCTTVCSTSHVCVYVSPSV